MKHIIFKSKEELKEHIKTHRPSFYISSKTSTVIPYDKIEKSLNLDPKIDFYLADLSNIPGQMWLEDDHLVVEGNVSWETAKDFLQKHGRNIKTSPTEQLALVLAGVATSCTGERCFGYGNLRSQIVSLKYLSFEGEEVILHRENDFTHTSANLTSYQQDFKKYEHFKNAPYPRFLKEIDLMIGTEGQLGVITQVKLETVLNFPVTHLFITLDRWEDNISSHLEIYEKIQKFREQIISCELLDANCMNYLPPEDRLGTNQDIIFLEIKSSHFDDVYNNFLGSLQTINESNVFEISSKRFHFIRAEVPRMIFEENTKMKVTKIGTDVQVLGKENFSKLLIFYQSCKDLNIRYCLFGHFGDAHLHFNYMPSPVDYSQCLAKIEQLYELVPKWQGSPFAEHGIGLLKQKYLDKFHGINQLKLFSDLKKTYDPHEQFFPQGFMSRTLSS